MTVQPDDKDQLYRRLRDRLRDFDDRYSDTSIDGLTNFAEGSFNRIWVESFSEGLYDAQVQALAAQLSGWIDYAGKDLTQSDLDDLGVSDQLDPEDVNEYMEEEHLDELVALLGVTRSPPTRARMLFEVYFNNEDEHTEDDLVGETFGTAPDRRGGQLLFDVVEEDSEPIYDGDRDEYYVECIAEARETGEQYNLPIGSVRQLIDPATYINSATNVELLEEGSDQQDTESLREEAKEALGRQAQGGTARGITAYILQNTGASEVVVEEFPDGINPDRPEIQYPHVDVIVDGGEREDDIDSDSDDLSVDEALEQSRPTAIRHFIVRPTLISVNIQTNILSEEDVDVNPDVVRTDVEEKLQELGLGDDLFRDRLRQRIMNADGAITIIDELTVEIAEETHDLIIDETTLTRGSDDRDSLTDALDETGELAAVLTTEKDETYFEYGEDNDWYRDGDDIVWNTDVLEEGDEYTVRFIQNIVQEQTNIYEEGTHSYEIFNPFTEVNSVFDDDTEYIEDEDYLVTDTGIEWIEDGDRPANGVEFYIEYVTDRQRIDLIYSDVFGEVTSITSNDGTVEMYTVNDGTLIIEDGAEVFCDDHCVSVSYTVTGNIVTTDRQKITQGEVTVEVCNQ